MKEQITLTTFEQELILECKSASPNLKAFYKKHFPLDPKECPAEFENCIFTRMHALLHKISQNLERELTDAFSASFSKRLRGDSADEHTPRQMAIDSLKYSIRFNAVLSGDGSERYELPGFEGDE